MSCSFRPARLRMVSEMAATMAIEQQHGRELERIDVLGVQQLAELGGVAVVAPAAAARRVVDVDARGCASTPRSRSRTTTTPATMPPSQRVAREAAAHFLDVDVEHHDDEQEQHHHRADVDQHQHDGEELRLDQQPDGTRW